MTSASPDLPEITDELMREMLGWSREYTVVLLKAAAGGRPERSNPLVWEHARRNFALRAAGLLAVVLPVQTGDELCGVGIFNASPEEVRRLMDGDPAVAAGLFTYEVHTGRSFPGDALPA